MQETDTPKVRSEALPPGWLQVIQRYVEAYGNARCERWYEDLVYIDHGLPKQVYFNDRVLNGFARKAARTLAYTCAECGRPGRARFLGDGWAVRCAACHGKISLVVQIDELLQAALDEPVSPFDGKSTLWFEHELPLLLRSCIPDECWRHTVGSSGRAMRYVAREDVQGMTPWFKRLQHVMQNRPAS